MEFNIGDRVRVKSYNKLPEGNKNKGIARIQGLDGEIVDKLWSGAKGCTIYRVHLDGMSVPSKVDFQSDSLDLITELAKTSYTYEFEFLDNLVVARLYDVSDDTKVEIAKGHGHIFHEGIYGIAQAASYAMRQIMYSIEEKEGQG